MRNSEGLCNPNQAHVWEVRREERREEEQDQGHRGNVNTDTFTVIM